MKKIPDTVITIECLPGGFVVQTPVEVPLVTAASDPETTRVEYARAVYPSLAKAKRAVTSAMAEWSHIAKKDEADEA